MCGDVWESVLAKAASITVIEIARFTSGGGGGGLLGDRGSLQQRHLTNRQSDS